jgi:hypothetical protein
MDGREEEPVVFDAVVGEGEIGAAGVLDAGEVHPTITSPSIKSTAKSEAFTLANGIPYYP